MLHYKRYAEKLSTNEIELKIKQLQEKMQGVGEVFYLRLEEIDAIGEFIVILQEELVDRILIGE